ncbi:MFS general substrate transporter [Coprinellus micaceus]|uniref:MFS general substrate transporter n=1 Tax=Coprinellus micaceus TaxID=71717 RepID=A0A4Y7TKS4_COPMI|nr:MFS general substrate transporter [Coprinellus micaceus]
MNQSNTESFRRLFDGDRNGHTTTNTTHSGFDRNHNLLGSWSLPRPLSTFGAPHGEHNDAHNNQDDTEEEPSEAIPMGRFRRQSGDGPAVEYTPLLDESFRDDELGDAEECQKISPTEAQEAERNLVRKLDWRILPVTCLLYLFAYLDRSNLGNARLQGLPEDVLGGDPTGKKFDWIVSVFYISYIVCQIPAVIASKLFPPRVWMAFAAMGWGISSTLMASAVNFAGLVVCRLAIGVFEAGFGPAIPLYFSLFYTKAEMGLRMAYWFGFAAVAGAFGGLIAFGVQHLDVSVARWKLLFIVEGLPSFLIGIAALWVLPNRPESTSIFNERERKMALERMNRSTRADVGLTVNRGHILLAFMDWRIYVCGVIYFGLNTALASISAFLPTIIATFGHSNAISQLLTVPPYASATVVLILFARTSDIKQSRGVFMAIACVISGVGYLILLLSHNMRSRYFATFCITSGTYTTIGLTIAWFSHNLGSETKKATGIPMFMAIGQCGSILGSHIFPKSEGPNYTKGFAVCCALAFLSATCSGILSISYRVENALKEAKYGKVDPDAPVDTRELADKAPNFRYVP